MLGPGGEVGLPSSVANWQQVVAQSPRRVAITLRSAAVLSLGIAPGWWWAMISRMRSIRSQWLAERGLFGAGLGSEFVFIGGWWGEGGLRGHAANNLKQLLADGLAQGQAGIDGLEEGFGQDAVDVAARVILDQR